ncbi:SDR family NAD(P)-dependent oxidoreductase [Caenimonas soli]|uniref:SDR family NAD(P)-dependent oxidoreductase n=1 Tax=Caenimonas soli TaxID=2735555 RepID=UPI00155532D3|nr:SDR family oxidoreductase [Caenimonas soli]NPC59024.1 SDR family oxidoreductase [Caenimonas soli]
MTTPAQPASWLQLEDKVCVVTGAAGGIGAEIAREFAAVGAKVALLDRDEKGAIEVAAAIAESGAEAIAVGCDITDKASVDRAAEAVERALGRCDVLVNNAAAIYADALMNIDLAKWNQLMAVNLGGFLLCSQAFGRQMIAGGGGSMVHVASISGRVPQPYSGPYSVSKAGVKMLSQLLAVELGEHGIRSNVVSPAMVRTPMSEVIYQNLEVLKKREQIVPARRISGPRDIAEVVVYLASPRSGYVSGQDVLVDGGLSTAWLTLIPRPGFEKQDAQQA